MAKETVESLYQKAQQAIARSDNEGARGLYMQALGLKSDAPEVHYGLATVCFLLNDLASAVYHFKEVTRLDPHRAGAHINLGAIYNRMDMLDEAIPALRRGIQLDHNRAEGFYNLGIVYRRKGQPELAVQAYREAVRINPRMCDAHYNIGNIYLEKEQYGMALAHYKQALTVRPNWDKALQSLQQCEAILNTTRAGPAASTASSPAKNEGGGNGANHKEVDLDPKRMVNPDTHGPLLTALHKAAIDSDVVSRSFLKIVETEIEPAINELSSVLLHPDGSAHELGLCLEKFESAIAAMRGAQQELNTSMERVHKLGDKLVRS